MHAPNVDLKIAHSRVVTVLVLLATKNGERVIVRQLESIYSQASISLKIDVRDDGSSDDTRNIVADAEFNKGFVSIRENHEPTGSAAGNFFELVLGASLDEVDFVALSDQDDYWYPNKLVRAVSCLVQSSSDGYSSGVRAVWPDGHSKELTQSRKIRVGDYLFEGAGQGCTFVLTAAFFSEIQSALRRHKEALANIHYHDWTIYSLSRTLGKRWYFDQQITMDYLQHAGNDTGARSSGSGVLRRLSLIRQGWYRRQVKAMVDLVLAVNGEDQAAGRWRAISEAPVPDFRHRLSRLEFVARHGRRRFADRLVLVFAVLAGYL